MTIFDEIKNTEFSSGAYEEEQPLEDVSVNALEIGLSTTQMSSAYKDNVVTPSQQGTLASALTKPVSAGIQNLYSNVAMATDFTYWSESDYGEGNFLPQVPIDKFRFVSQKYWDIYDGKTMYFLKKGFSSSKDVPFDMEVNEAGRATYIDADGLQETVTTIKLIPSKSKFKKFRADKNPPLDQPDQTFAPVQTTTITSPYATTLIEDSEFVLDVWKNYLTSAERFTVLGRQEISWDRIIEFNKKNFDSTFNLVAPTNDGMQNNEKYFTTTSQYNYYHSTFERIAALGSVDENYMPNLYTNYSAKNNSQVLSRRLFAVNTLKGKMKNVLKSISSRSGDRTLFDYYQIFDEWSSTVTSLSEADKSTLISNMSHLILTEDDIEQGLMAEVSPAEKVFPGSIKLEFSGDPVGEVKAVFGNAKITDTLVGAVAKIDVLNSAAGIVKPKISFRYDQKTDSPVLETSLPAYDLDQFVLKDMDINAFAHGDVSRSQNVIASDFPTETFTTSIDSIKNKIAPQESQLASVINAAIIKGKLRTLINKRSRTATELLNGTVSYSDTVFYKIEKFKYVNKGNYSPVPSQTFYIPASDKESLTYFDTQVKYKQKYHYKIYAYVAVFGTEYEYAPLEGKQEIDFDSDGNAYFSIITRPKVDLIEVPYIDKGAVLIDRPPTSPSVEFIPYIGPSRDIKISLSATFGDSLEVPIQILNADEKPIWLATQNESPDEHGRIKYSGDDNIARYQVFTTTRWPTKPEDFKTSVLRYIDTNTSDRPSAHTLETSFVEKLQFNQKYYYAFRSIDIHENISNLSRIFEVEIINNDGAVYTVVRNVDYKTPETKFRTKNVRKYLRIRAADSQKYFDTKTILDNLGQNKAEDVSLGPDQQNLWNRKFKFRLTSSDTGRKIDINVKFSYDVKGYEFSFMSGAGQIIQADSFTEALQLLLIEQSVDLI